MTILSNIKLQELENANFLTFFRKGKSVSWTNDASADSKLGHDKYADYPVSIDSLSLITVISVDWSGCFYIGMTYKHEM